MAGRRVTKWVLAFCGLLIILGCSGGPFGLATLALLYVGFGWIGFFARVVPALTINWQGVATALGCLAAGDRIEEPQE